MTVILIFDDYDRNGCKDIVFYTSHTGLVLPLVHISTDSAFMPSLSHVFAICH